MSAALHTRTQLHFKLPEARLRKHGRHMQPTQSSAEHRLTFWDQLRRSRQPPCPSSHDVGYTISASEWHDEGAAWRAARDQRLQHVLSHMNHHVHLRDETSGERKPFKLLPAQGQAQRV